MKKNNIKKVTLRKIDYILLKDFIKNDFDIKAEVSGNVERVIFRNKTRKKRKCVITIETEKEVNLTIVRLDQREYKYTWYIDQYITLAHINTDKLLEALYMGTIGESLKTQDFVEDRITKNTIGYNRGTVSAYFAMGNGDYVIN